jgi:hypothetical protein
MTLPEILALALLALAGWFVWDSLRAREAANRAMRDACAAQGLLFLDDTVAIRSLRPLRDADGQLRLQRVYGFEYSDTGTNRRPGTVSLVGTRIERVDLGVVAPGATPLG